MCVVEDSDRIFIYDTLAGAAIAVARAFSDTSIYQLSESTQGVITSLSPSKTLIKDEGSQNKDTYSNGMKIALSPKKKIGSKR